MTSQETQQDVIKAISDKLAELEDLQLVNKLDIINVKNELDRSSLSGGPSSQDMDKISDLKEILAKSDKLKKSVGLATEIEEMKVQFEKIKKLDSANLRRDFESLSKELDYLKEKISASEKKGTFQKGGKIADPDLEELRQRIGKLESVHPSEIDLEIPEEVREELSKINGKISALEKSKPSATAGRMEKVDELSGRIASLIKTIDEQKEKIKDIESSLSAEAPAPADKKGKGKASKDAGVPAAIPAVITGRLDRLEKKFSDLYSKSSGQKAAPADDKVDALSEEMMFMKARMDGLEKTAKAAGTRQAAPKEETGKLSSLEDELLAMKSRMEGLEKSTLKAAEPAKDTGVKGRGLSEMQARMDRIEASLEKASKLAMNLRPIEMPVPKDAPKASKDLEFKVRELERTVGSGVGETRFKAIEKKVDDIREWLPEYIDNKVEKRLSEFNKKVGGEVKEMEGLKKELIDSTIEQMLAQPATVGRMLGEKIQKQVSEVQERLKKMDGAAKPTDAKFTTLVQDMADLQKEVSGMKLGVKSGKAGEDKGEIRELEMDVKALAARLNSLSAAPAKASEEKAAGKQTSGKDISGIQKEIADIWDEMKSLRAAGGKPSGKQAPPSSREIADLQKEIAKIKDEMKAAKPTGKEDIEDMGIEVRALTAKLESMHSSVKSVEESGVSGVMRDLEILKTKADWLESTIHKLDLEKIYARIDELEGMVRFSVAHAANSGPIIIE
jgi:hypothetical protein